MKFKDCFDLCEKYYGGLSERDEFIHESKMNIRKDKFGSTIKEWQIPITMFQIKKDKRSSLQTRGDVHWQ